MTGEPPAVAFRGGAVYLTYHAGGPGEIGASRLRGIAERCAAEHGRTLSPGGLTVSAVGDRTRLAFRTVTGRPGAPPDQDVAVTVCAVPVTPPARPVVVDRSV